MKLKESDIKNLQNEIETLQMMIRQLEIQKTEAAKRLDELANQVRLIEAFIFLSYITKHFYLICMKFPLHDLYCYLHDDLV